MTKRRELWPFGEMMNSSVSDEGGSMQVDPQVLRGFAGQVDGVAGAMKGANLGTTVSTAADGL